MTHPFEFPIPWCDDVVEDIDPDTWFFIAIDMDSGYWQIVAEPEAQARLAFFTPEGKKWWMVMPMGALNLAPIFVVMMLALQQKWDCLAEEQGIMRCGSKVIVDDVLVFGRDPDSLL